MEQPNTNYIDELSGDNCDFKEKIIAILKKELPEEIEIYNNHIQNHDLQSAAQSVHKLKHKISILSLEKSYYIAEQFEIDLKTNKIELQSEFETILKMMNQFVSQL